jgi:hypothetical protein
MLVCNIPMMEAIGDSLPIGRWILAISSVNALYTLLTCKGDQVVLALRYITIIKTYTKEIVEADRVSSLWKYFLATKSVDAREKMQEITTEKDEGLPIVSCLYNIMYHNRNEAVMSIIEAEEIVKLLDDELAKKMNLAIIGIIGLLNQLIMCDLYV